MGPEREWCRKEELNLRPAVYETAALPTELFRHNLWLDTSKPRNMHEGRQLMDYRFNANTRLTQVYQFFAILINPTTFGHDQEPPLILK